MKQKILSIFLLLLLLVTPIVAEDQAYTILLNDIPYTTSAPLLTKDDNLLIALEDFSKLTFTPITQDKNTYHFNFGTKRVVLESNTRVCKISSTNVILPYPTLIVDGVPYISVGIFEALGIPHTLDVASKLLSLPHSVPFSRNIDKPEDHRFLESKSNLEQVASHILQLSSDVIFKTTLDHSLATKGYMGYMDNTHWQTIASELEMKMGYSPYHAISVTFRELDTTVYPNVLKNTVTYPVSIRPRNQTLHITFNDQTLPYHGLWSVFYPSHSLTAMDIQKTIDATLMRAFYEYYRNTYDLRDDKYFSPLITLTSDRTNTMTHGAYSLSHEGVETHYNVHVYRVHPSGAIRYIVDIEK
ncbi:MAG: hypothetical protein ACRCWY_13075, partial [Cellulosilyticaceae bacterium]